MKSAEGAEVNFKRLWACQNQPYSASPVSSAVFIDYSSAITSISTSTSFGNRETSTVERAGGAELKYLP